MGNGFGGLRVHDFVDGGEDFDEFGLGDPIARVDEVEAYLLGALKDVDVLEVVSEGDLWGLGGELWSKIDIANDVAILQVGAFPAFDLHNVVSAVVDDVRHLGRQLVLILLQVLPLVLDSLLVDALHR